MVKKIHYIWLGGKEKPRIARKCIASWKKLMPDWEIIEWNESNVNIDTNMFCRLAYDAKMYAFSSDVLRFKILHEEGGLYFDTDVKMMKPFYDLVENNDAFAGFEFSSVGPGLVLYVKESKNKILQEVLDVYNSMSFLNEDGSRNLKTVGHYFTAVLIKYGYKPKNELQRCGGFTIFPNTYFCPWNYTTGEKNFSDDTHSIHLFAASWLGRKRRISNVFIGLIYRMFGKSFVEFVVRVKAFIKRNASA